MRTHIKGLSRFNFAKIGTGLACWLTVFGLTSPPPAEAALVVNGRGGIQFSTRDIVSNSSVVPMFTSNSGDFPMQLLSAGNGNMGGRIGYPVISTELMNSSITGPSAITPTPLTATATFPNFGTGRTTLNARSTPTGTSGPVMAGTFFSPAAVSGIVGGTATVSVSSSDVTITNTGPRSVRGRPGNAISVKGSVSSQGGFVEAALTGSFVYSHDGTISTGNFNPIIIAFNGPGPRGNFIDVIQDNTQSVSPINSSDLGFTAAQSSNLGSITLDKNDTFRIKSTLTLIADPGTIEVTNFPPGLDLPEFGNFVLSGAVPEPASIISLSVGMAAVGLCIGWRRVAGQRPRPKDTGGG